MIADLTNDGQGGYFDDQGLCYFNNSLYVPRIGQLTKIDLNTMVTSRFAGNGTRRDGQNSTAVFNRALLCTTDPLGNIYVSESGESNNIRGVNQTGYVSTLVANMVDKAFGMVYNSPEVYFTSWYPSVVYKINVGTKVVSVVYGKEFSPPVHKDGQGINCELLRPTGLAFDELLNLYVSSNDEALIAKANSSGYVSTFAGTAMAGQNLHQDGVRSFARFEYQRAMVFDSDGRLLVTDGSAVRIVTW